MAEGYNSEDDFQSTNAVSFQDLLNVAIADVGSIRNLSRPPKRARTKQKPGPKPSVVRLKFYFLPDGSEIPKFSRRDPAIERHQSSGYGFPHAYYIDGKVKKHTMLLDLSDVEFKESIRSLYPRLSSKDFMLFTNAHSRILTPAPFNLQHFRDSKYQGIVIIKLKDENTSAANMTVPGDTSVTASTSIPHVSTSTSVPTNASMSVPRNSSTVVPTNVSTSTSVPTNASMSVPRNSSTVVPTNVSTSTSVPTNASMSVPRNSSTVVPTNVSTSTSVPTNASMSVPRNSSTVVPTNVSTSTSVPTNASMSGPRNSSTVVPTNVSTSTSVPTNASMSVPRNSSTVLPTNVSTSTSVPTNDSTSVPRNTSTAAFPVPFMPAPAASPISSPQPQQNWISAGTPTVQIHPRHRLILEQDIAFAASLSADQERVQNQLAERTRRNLERRERQRQRNEKKRDLEQMQSNAVEEITNLRLNSPSADIIQIIFRLPDQSEIRKSVSKMTKSETLHLYLEATTEVCLVKLVFGGKLIDRDHKPLSNYGVDGNCCIMVEEVIVEDSSDESGVDEFEDVDADEPKNLLEINDLINLEERCAIIGESLLPAVEVKISRENVVEDVLNQYRQNPDLVHHRLNVVFEEEEAALDLEGVTREMFSCFFLGVFLRFFHGSSQKIPVMNPRVLFSGTFELIGRVISHALVLCNYIPPAISPIILVMAGNGVCSDELVRMGFLSFLSENDRLLVELLETSDSFQQLQDQMINFISNYGGLDLPTETTFRHDIIQIARTNLIAIPFYAISCIRRGMECYPLLWKGVTENLVLKLMDKNAPNPQKVVALISYSMSEDPALVMLEERVKGYLERFILQLTKQQLFTFLRFWTSSDTLCVRNLNVVFNSMDGINRRPIANTCSATLHLSRRYLSVEEFIREFNIYLNDASSIRFDSV